ncbi:MAG: TRAP transporter substrate-binding protein [Candidatus Rokubacteria bacterium]|nr:TRAP transporter substrate-binding protein [Candidatus Rokubacteria bacterium]
MTPAQPVSRRRFLRTSASALGAGVALLSTRAPLAAPTVLAQAGGPSRTITIRFGTVSAAAAANARADRFFTDEVNRRANGALQVQLFTDGQIGASRDLLEGIQLGTVQMAEVSTANITPFLADTLVFDLPYVFTSTAQLLKFLDSPLGSETLAIQRFGSIGMRGLTWYNSGSRSIYNSRRPIVTPDDLKGLKIRVEENPVRVAAFNAMGAQATPMAFSEVYGALQQKTIDGAENPALGYMANKHHEVAPFFSRTEHFMTPNTIVIGKKFLDGLPRDLQDLLAQAGRDTSAYERKLWDELEAKVTGEMQAAGAKINDADKKAFQARVKKVQQDQAGKVPKAWWDAVMLAAGV